MNVYETALQAHYIRPYGRPRDRFGLDVADPSLTELPPADVTEAEARARAYEDPYVLALEDLAADPHYQDAASQARIQTEIADALNYTTMQIQQGQKRRDSGQALAAVDRFIQALTADTARSAGQFGQPTPTVRPNNTTGYVIAAAAAVVLVAAFSMR